MMCEHDDDDDDDDSRISYILFLASLDDYCDERCFVFPKFFFFASLYSIRVDATPLPIVCALRIIL